MRNWTHATTFILFSSTAIALFSCGGSSDNGSGNPNPGIGGNLATGGANAGGGALVTGGAGFAGSSDATTGGGALVLTGGGPAAGGSVAGGNAATGGAAKATGGSAATTSPADIQSLCASACTILEPRNPPLACLPQDCETTCLSTYTKLNGSSATCGSAFFALYQCGVTQPAEAWECYTVKMGGVTYASIPIPKQGGPCQSQVTNATTVIMGNMACALAVAS